MRSCPSRLPTILPMPDQPPTRQQLDDQLSQRFIALDPAGYFLIRIDRQAQELVAEHYGNGIDGRGLATDPETGEVLSCRGGGPPRQPLAVFVRPSRLALPSPRDHPPIPSVVSTMPSTWAGSCNGPRPVWSRAWSTCRTESGGFRPVGAPGWVRQGPWGDRGAARPAALRFPAARWRGIRGSARCGPGLR
jgi:hypothetical protein